VLQKGKLIIIESGTDGSGKETQSERLYSRLRDEGYKVKKITYPNYQSDSSALVKMYLNGEFGKNPDDVNPYVASTFYAVDRFASFRKEWERFYLDGGIVISDRYTTSNMVHQAAKMQGEERDEYLDWLWEFEFVKFNLPVPDKVIFLDMPIEMSEALMEKRTNKITGTQEKDIHERNKDYMRNSYNTSLYIADKYQWQKISCVSDNALRSIEDIHNDIFNAVKPII
jgi:dTMP kinase